MRMAGMIYIATMSLMVSLYAGEINSEQLIDGYITCMQKAEGTKLTEDKTKEARQELQQCKDNPLLAPYIFKGEKCDRVALTKVINTGIQKLKASEVSLSKFAVFVANPKNLGTLSDAELVVAFRHIEQLVEQVVRTFKK